MNNNSEDHIFEGVFTANPKGFGFVTVEGQENDFFVPEKEKNGAFHMDTVRIKVMQDPRSTRTMATVLKILSHEITQLVGTFRKNSEGGYVTADNRKIVDDIFISRALSHGARENDKVVVQITSYGGRGMKPAGRVLRILGNSSEPGVDILSVICSEDLPVEFPEDVRKEACSLPKTVSRSSWKGRMDLRDLQTVTVDGEDTKDFDDAVSLTFDGKNYHLGVHIADVAEYVKEGSLLDQEALKRGTSVYLPDRVIPMLPLELSNGICSLNEGQDRLTLSCLMTMGPRGKLKDVQISESVIRVNRRMTYKDVARTLSGDAGLREEYADLVPMFELMSKLSRYLRARRTKRGAVDFDFPETKILVDENGKTLRIEKEERNTASLIIEDFMLAANEAVAEYFCKRKIPFLYRDHAAPSEESIKSLKEFAGAMGFSLNTEKGKVKPADIQKLLNDCAGTVTEAPIHYLTLRSMQQAYYSSDCIGHFGLAAPYYCHFTSPIRRYPDTQIHRIIKDYLHGRTGKKVIAHYEKLLPGVALSCSAHERRADETERMADKLKEAEFMQDHIDEEFDGRISGITSWGIYVELENTVEGMIHVSNMFDDHYVYREKTYDMIGEHRGRVYTLGQQVRIRVIDADKEKRQIDFVFA